MLPPMQGPRNLKCMQARRYALWCSQFPQLHPVEAAVADLRMYKDAPPTHYFLGP